jgi:hypothetical protein
MKKVLFLALVVPILVGLACKRDSEITIEQVEIAKAKVTLKRLMPNFKYEKDPGWVNYTHVEIDSFNIYTERPKAFIDLSIVNYKIFCSVIFNTTNLLFITKISVKIDDEIMTVSGFSSRRDDFMEYIRIEQDDLHKVLRFIAAADLDKDVKVRLDGKKGHYDFTLDKMHHQAICETMSLLDALELLIKIATDPSKM